MKKFVLLCLACLLLLSGCADSEPESTTTTAAGTTVYTPAFSKTSSLSTTTSEMIVKASETTQNTESESTHPVIDETNIQTTEKIRSSMTVKIIEQHEDYFVGAYQDLDPADNYFDMMYEIRATIDHNYQIGDCVEVESYYYVGNELEIVVFDKKYEGGKTWEGIWNERNYTGDLLGVVTALSVSPSTEEAFIGNNSPKTAKPVIYLYPEEPTQVNVQLFFSGELVHSFPVYPENGWNVTAYPDGRLFDQNGLEYPYLFWDGNSDAVFTFDEGFCVRGSETKTFLTNKLQEIGLNAVETNDFLKYWLPLMRDNAYNIISFQAETYTDTAKLHITPKPDSELRVFMAFKPSDTFVKLKPQEFPAFTRDGFTVVEWGGSFVQESE